MDCGDNRCFNSPGYSGRMKWELKTVICLLTIWLFSIAALADETNSDPELTPSQLPNETKQQILTWNLYTLIGAHDRAGFTNVLWDGPADAALIEYAKVRARMESTNPAFRRIIFTNASAAIQAGCGDPMLKYLALRYSPQDLHDYQDLASKFFEIAKAIHRTTYPSLRKFYADARVLENLKQMTNEAFIFPIRIQTLPHLTNDLDVALTDNTMPSQEAYDAASFALSVSQNKFAYQRIYDSLGKLFDTWPYDYRIWLLAGQANVHMAWDARGTGWADTVTDEGWRAFNARLGVARRALEHAWILNQQDTAIAHEMMTVALGEGGDRKNMELWFNRAMDLDTNDFEACSHKLYYLEPKWYGSDDEQISFGRECVRSQKWGGRVPLILVDAHYGVCNRLDPSDRDAYWKRPEVWTDITASYERYFELNPAAINGYQKYAWYACEAEQWGKLNELLAKIKGAKINYNLFGGEDGYNKVLQLAREHGYKDD